MSETLTPEVEEEHSRLNPIVEWANNRPHWEKYIWKHFLEKGGLTTEEQKEAYKLFKISNGILSEEKLDEIDLTELTPPSTSPETKQPLTAIKGIENVNALPDGTEIEFGPQLTVCYGQNGSGKSGYGRIIASACFTRGERVIHPNLKSNTVSTNPAKAEFIVGSGAEEQTISYTHGDVSSAILKRFSMFDSHSAHIQLNDENTLQFTPAQLAVFDKVNTVVKNMEALLADERSQRLKSNPLENSFGDKSSAVSEALLTPDLIKQDQEILTYTELPEEGEKQIEELTKKKDDLVKKNIDAEKKKLGEDKSAIQLFKSELETFMKNYSNEGKDKINELIKDVNDKKKLVVQLGTETFNDGIFKSTGSDKWKSLLRAAKELYDHEAELHGEEVEFGECLLCHQPLTDKEKTLFGNYWAFLASTAAADLKKAQDTLNTEKKRIEQVRLTPPRTGDDEAVIKTLLSMGKTELVEQLRTHLKEANSTLLSWDGKIYSLTDVDNVDIPVFLATNFDPLVKSIDDKVSKLKDPKKDIEALDKQIVELQHRKTASNLREKYKEYLKWRRWQVKADRVSMIGTKRNYTDERSSLFDAIVTENYVRAFQEECRALRADTDLEIRKRGSDGKTLVSKKLKFSRDKAPSEILSEGEQKVCALADFLSEARLDPGNWGIIFDDPVTSLDHRRKDRIAKRLVAQTNERQVIVFTHDITFLLSLMYYAERDGVDCKKITVRKVGADSGVADSKMPWVAQRCKDRCSYLKNDLQEIGAMMRKGVHEHEIEMKVKGWCELLRESWERAVEERVLQGTIERFRDAVETSRLKKLDHLQDPTILSEVEAGMTESSKWVHDRAAGLNVPAPDEADLKAYITRYENFLKKCKIK